MCPEALVISGDFSLHLDDLRDNDTKKFEDLLETFNLSQNVSGPTHLPGQTWDLIITRSSDDIVLASPKTTFPISDHFIIQCPIGFSRPALSCKKLTFRKLKNIDIATFSADIASSMLCANVHWDNIDALSDCFNKILTDILDKFARLKQGLWLIVERSHGFMMTLKNSSVNVVVLKREPWKLTSLVTGIITITFVISTLHFLNLRVWIIIQT